VSCILLSCRVVAGGGDLAIRLKFDVHVCVTWTSNKRKNLLSSFQCALRISFLAATTTSHHHHHRTPPKRVFMLVFGVLTIFGHHHNDDDAENRGDGCASPILQQGTFSFENMYLLTISPLPTGHWGDTCSPHPFWARQGGHLLATSTPPPPPFSSSFFRLVPLYHHHPSCHHYLPSPLKTSIRARFRDWLLFATTLLTRKQAHTLVFEGSCSLPPPSPSSLKTEHTRSFLRLVALCHHHPSPSKTSIRACFRGRLFFATTSITLLPWKWAYALVFETGCSLPPPSSLKNEHLHSFSRVFNFLNVYNIINNIYFYFIWFRASGSNIIPFVQVWVLLGYTLNYFQLSLVCLI